MNAVTWVEVPVSDMSRAIKFYNSVFGWELEEVQFGDLSMAWFPWEQGGPGAAGSLVRNANYSPSEQGALVYFHCADVDAEASRIAGAGGQLLRGKTPISPEYGFMALALDTEGNRIALHSAQ